MATLAIASVSTEDNIYIRVSDVIEIERIPVVVKDFIEKFVKSVKIMDNGLPASGFLGKSGVKITGIFKYGELCFISYEGNKADLEAEELLHIFSNISEDDYDKLKEYVDEQLASLRCADDKDN